MKLRLLATVALFCTVAPAFAAGSSKDPGTEQMRMDRTFERLGNQFIQEGRTDGMSIAVVKDGKAHFYNFGTTTRGKVQPPTEKSVYEIGSISKIFTSLVLAHAVEEGRIGLQDDIRRYLPGDYPNLAWEGTPVRIVDLANTTSGLPDNLPNPFPQGKVDPDKAPFIALEAMKGFAPDQVYEELKAAKLGAKPGTKPQHSNLAADLLGRILEKVYGEPYEALIARYVEKPFGMASGTGRSRAADEVNGYNKRQVAMPRLYERAFLMAGGLRYSTTDMAKFLGAELAATDPAIRLSQQPVWGDTDEAATSLNWNLNKTVDGKLRLRMSGSTFGCSSYIEMYPELGYGIVLLANRPGETQNEMQELATHAMEEIWGKPPALAAFENALQAGNYQDVTRIATEVRRQHPELHLTEQYINLWGYRLLREDKPKQALGLFRYNAEQWPQSWNAFDSLAEAYEKLGDKPQAIANYRKSLELDPTNQNGAYHLKKLLAR
ncbi:serine hydrolase [Pseudoxanthomonas helianthi]|uniref:Beta-lactamase n=1 Tax=Pseudoxanthomonas helianthi TaxID=1453541 RepID=A0A940X5M7_9GAMM|nr:serine hydrolase [Pseudoxanthomonas helianthi]MBP3985512.1 serine hydrolase [Pseudoxanthomonas helianthi]